MSRIVTILGVITAIVIAVLPDLMSVNPTVARYLMLIGVAASAAGRELVTPAALRSTAVRTVALLVVVAGLIGLTACGPVGDRIASYSDKATRTVEQLRTAQVINQEEADRLVSQIGEVKSAGQELARVEQIIAESKEQKASKREQVRVASQAVVSALQRLEQDGVMHVKNPQARLQLQRAFAIASIILEFTQ